MASDPRGSFTIAERQASNSVRNRAARYFEGTRAQRRAAFEYAVESVLRRRVRIDDADLLHDLFQWVQVRIR